MNEFITSFSHYLKDSKVLETEVFLLSNGKWLLLIFLLALGYVLQKTIQYLWPKIFHFTIKTQNDWDDSFVGVTRPYVGRLFAGLFWFAAVRAMDFGERFSSVLIVGLKLYISLNIILIVYKSIDVFIAVVRRSNQRHDRRFDEQVFGLLAKTLKSLVVVFGFLVIVQNFGINVVSILAGLGLGGLAFALAAQDTCANFFGSVMILIDKPFRIGDGVRIGDIEGIVEDIGFRSTRIRTAYKSLVTLPNAQVAKANIDNLGLRPSRRLRFHLAIEYQTKPEVMRTFIEGIKQILRTQPSVLEDQIVAFDSYGEFSLNILVNFFLGVETFKEEIEIKEAVLFEIHDLANHLGLKFAFPTQTIHAPHLTEP